MSLRILFLCAVLSAAACGTDPTTPTDVGIPLQGKDAGSDAQADAKADTGTASQDVQVTPPPWPESAQPLPTCVPTNPTFAVPKLASTGDVAVLAAGGSLVVGAEHAVRLEVRIAGSKLLDQQASGVMTLTGGPAVHVVSVSAVAKGLAQAVVRFDEPGKHVLQATLADGRAGTAEFQGYVTKLPIWELEIAPADWKAMLAKPQDKAEYPAVFRAEGKVFVGAEVRIRGGASVDFPKKSLQVELPKGQQLANGERKLVLRAEYLDKTMLRTWLAYEVFRNATWLPTPRSEFVHLRLNGEYYGLMNHVQRIGGDFLTQWGRNPEGELYEADPPLQLSNNPGGNLTPLDDPAKYALVYDKHAGTPDFTDLITFIEVHLQTSNSVFFDGAPDLLKLDELLAYFATMAVLQNYEHIRKNYYLYRDLTGPDRRWELFPWDLDMTFGHLWTEANDVLDEQIFVDSPLDVGVKVPEHSFYNQLYRLLDHPPYRSRFEAFVVQVANFALDPEFVDGRIAWALCQIEADLLADSRKRSKNEEYLSRVEELRSYAAGRLAFIHKELDAR